MALLPRLGEKGLAWATRAETKESKPIQSDLLFARHTDCRVKQRVPLPENPDGAAPTQLLRERGSFIRWGTSGCVCVSRSRGGLRSLRGPPSITAAEQSRDRLQLPKGLLWGNYHSRIYKGLRKGDQPSRTNHHWQTASFFFLKTHFQTSKVHIFDNAAVFGEHQLLQQEAAELQGGQTDFAICGREEREREQDKVQRKPIEWLIRLTSVPPQFQGGKFNTPTAKCFLPLKMKHYRRVGGNPTRH